MRLGFVLTLTLALLRAASPARAEGEHPHARAKHPGKRLSAPQQRPRAVQPRAAPRPNGSARPKAAPKPNRWSPQSPGGAWPARAAGPRYEYVPSAPLRDTRVSGPAGRVPFDEPPRHKAIRNPKLFARGGAPPPLPSANAKGAPLSAVPLARPLAQHAAVFRNRAVINSIALKEKNETEPGRYYWHRDGGVDYVHRYADGAHWYAFLLGSTYYWTQYHAGRWWWYDPGASRYVYYGDGNWWYQDPAQPQTVYVYQNDAYVPYAAGAPAEYPPSAPPSAPPSDEREVIVSAAPADPEAAAAPRSDVDEPTYFLKEDPDRVALVIGVENYAALPKAEFAERDAQAVRAHLEHLGYAERNIVVLTSSQAARASIAKYVESWLPERVTDRSQVFVFFAGHGAPDPKTGATYLMPWDGDAKYLKNTGYPLKDLYAHLDALPAKDVVVALDACFSGSGGRSVLASGTRPLATKVDMGASAAGKAVVFSAAGELEITGTLPEQGHGLFTYYFLKGLNGEAASDQNGVTAADLFDYLAPKVADAARRDNRDQTPQLLVGEGASRKLLVKDLR